MKIFTAVTGNGSTFTYIAERMELKEGYFHFFVEEACIGVVASYGICAITDQPYNQKYVRQ